MNMQIIGRRAMKIVNASGGKRASRKDSAAGPMNKMKSRRGGKISYRFDRFIATETAEIGIM